MGKWIALLLPLALAAPAQAGESAEIRCYDAAVQARVVRQAFTDWGDCGPDCIVMSGPWIWKLDVVRVIDGSVARGPQTVLVMAHTWYRTGPRPGKFWLRPNDQGGFNMIWRDRNERLARCSADVAPAQAFLKPGPGKRLEDYELETRP